MIFGQAKVFTFVPSVVVMVGLGENVELSNAIILTWF